MTRPNHDPATIAAVLATRAWVQRRRACTGQHVTTDDLAAYLAKHYPDLRGPHLGYAMTYAMPATREWPGGPT